MRYYSLEFRLGRMNVKVEVRAKNRKQAAIRIRQRIKAMPDVETGPKFHYSEVTVGVPVLESRGHNQVAFEDRKRPAFHKPIPEYVPDASDVVPVSAPRPKRKRRKPGSQKATFRIPKVKAVVRQEKAWKPLVETQTAAQRKQMKNPKPAVFVKGEANSMFKKESE